MSEIIAVNRPAIGPEPILLTTSEAADLMGVHASTIKRWADEGRIRVRRTEGGHRRIRLDEVLSLARAEEIATILDPFGADAPRAWTAFRKAQDAGDFDPVLELGFHWVTGLRLEEVAALLIALGREEAVPWEALLDEVVQPLMEAVGRAWEEGRLGVGQEHLVSQLVTEALFSLRAGLPPRSPDSPAAVVCAGEGSQHQIGALGIRLLLEKRGWRVHYLGAAVPLEEVAAIQAWTGARLVCVSVARPAASGDVIRCIHLLERFYDPEHPFDLVVGGSAVDQGIRRRWTGPKVAPGSGRISSVGILGSATEFLAWLAEDGGARSEGTHP